VFEFSGYTFRGWFAKSMSWAQLTLTDDDSGTFDPDLLFKYFRDIRTQGAVLSTGGVHRPSSAKNTPMS
jgi:hypothetical protein